MSKVAQSAPEPPKYPADELQERHPEIYMQMRMAIIRIRGDKRPKDYSIDLVLKALAPILTEEYNVGLVED